MVRFSLVVAVQCAVSFRFRFRSSRVSGGCLLRLVTGTAHSELNYRYSLF
jgi:hypothetical protein